ARTKRLTRRLHPGDIAVIDHDDLDRLAAEELVEAQPGAVLNAGRSISGRYPNVGPLLVAAAGIPLVDDVGPELMERLHEGGAELVVHAYPGGHAPGAARLEASGRSYTLFEAAGTSEDIAMVLAYEKGAELIVAVGTHASLVDFLDKGRAGMASTFLVRLKVGPILVDAKGVNRLYQSRVRKSDLAFLVGAALLAMLVTAIVAQPIHVYLRGLW